MTAHQDVIRGREERDSQAETWLSLGDNGNGTWTGKFVIPELHGQLLQRHLEMLSAPLRLSRSRDGEQVSDPTLPGTGWDCPGPNTSGSRSPSSSSTCPTTATPPTAPPCSSPSTSTPCRPDSVPPASRPGAYDLSAGEARRLACNAGTRPHRPGHRLRPPGPRPRRRPACTPRPNARPSPSPTTPAPSPAANGPSPATATHHPRPWSQGGRTDLANALPLCFFHHRRAHDTHFDLRRTSGGDWRFHRRR